MNPQLFDDLNPDFNIKYKLRAYRAIIKELEILATPISRFAGMHLKEAFFMLGYTLSEIGGVSPYQGGELSRKDGEKIIVEPLDRNFKFKTGMIPNEIIPKLDFLRANVRKMTGKIKECYIGLAVFDGLQFTTIDRAYTSLLLARGYLGEKLYKEAINDPEYAEVKTKAYDTGVDLGVLEPKKFVFK